MAGSQGCISSSTELLGPGLSFASAALFLFEYTLTFVSEVRFVWLRPRSTSAALFYVARYAGMASAVLTLVATPTTTVFLANLGTALRVVVIVASEAILAVRTWAIWGRSRPILLLLFLVSVGALAGEAVVIVRGVKGTHVQTDTTADGCEAEEVVSSQSNAYLVPYIIVLAYETLTTTLSAHRILRWRRQSQSQGGAAPPLLAVLWKDGLLYFSWMIGLGILNILLVLRGSVRSSLSLFSFVLTYALTGIGRGAQ
ncbi:hypothetical protein C8R46DRAFT_356732 [Mycena filopes]|nr:hypothetical protein C8R46DRAFT_356732 [Mycena filopes]